MSKMYGFSGKVTGKKGDAVFSVRNGEQIIRQYNPLVANPKTSKQVNSRARLKLMSQLSAILGPVIAIAREGAVSSRNLFTKVNYPLSEVNSGTAEIQLADVQLTKSHVGMISINADRTDGQHLSVHLNEDGRDSFARIVYVAIVKQPDTSIRLLGSAMTDEPGANGFYPAQLPYTANEVTVLAYGIHDNDDRVNAQFGNIHGAPAQGVAELITSRAILAGSVTLSETVGVTLPVGTNTADSGTTERATVSVSITGNGTVSGAGTYNVGSTIQLTANPSEGATFAGWYANNVLITTANPYTLTLSANVSIEARFQSTANVTLALTPNDAQMGEVSGAGSFVPGTSVTAHATPKSGYRFVNWTEGANVVSTAADYTFTINANRTLVANFAENSSSIRVAVEVSPANGGTITGDGQYNVGEQVTLKATAASGYTFSAWKQGSASGTTVSSNANYSFTAATDVVLWAVFTTSGPSQD